MSPDPDPAPNLAVFDGLYAVVMYASMGGRLRWSPEDHAWLRWSGLYDGWEPTVNPSASPDDDDLGAALALAARHDCWDCGGGPAVHFIEADAFGRPTRYCVQRPSASIVGSSGTKKHWGSPYGCLNSSAHHGQYDEYGRHDGMSAPGGWFLYGEPLAADRVIASEWCSRCTRTAGNLAANHGLFSGTSEEQAAAWAKYEQETAKQVEKRVGAVAKAWTEWMS